MIWRRASEQANIPREVRCELERHGEMLVQLALIQPQDVPTSPLHDIQYADRDHALAWLAEKRAAASRSARNQGIIALVGAGIGLVILYFTWQTYQSNRPTIVFESPRLDWARGTTSSVHLSFQNTGTRTAKEVSAIISGATQDGKAGIFLGRLGPIGNPIFPSLLPATAKITIDTEQLREFLLLCSAYSADDHRSFGELHVYRFIDWPPRDDQQIFSFSSESVNINTYRLISEANDCARLILSAPK
jgi:hypothetical protein